MTTARVAYLFDLVFGTTGFATHVLNISMTGLSRPSLPTSHMQTPQPGAGQLNNATFIPGKIIDGGGLQCQGHYDPNNVPPLKNAIETLTATWPMAEGSSVAATYSGPGFMTDFSITGQLDGIIECSFTLKSAGAWTVSSES